MLDTIIFAAVTFLFIRFSLGINFFFVSHDNEMLKLLERFGSFVSSIIIGDVTSDKLVANQMVIFYLFELGLEQKSFHVTYSNWLGWNLVWIVCFR